MRFLVTGGLGVVGSLLARHLLAGGHHVVIIDAAEEPRNKWAASELGEHARTTIYTRRMEEMDLRQIVKSVDAIVHAAAHTGIPHSALVPDDDWRSNVDATRALLEAMRITGAIVPTVVMSSVKPYRVHDLPVRQQDNRYVWVEPDDVLKAPNEWVMAKSAAEHGINERWPLEPDEPYAASKMAQTALCVAYARTYDLPIATLRFSNLYGPAPCHGARHGWLTWMCISKALGRPIEIQGSGLQVRDMLYADDIIAALLRSLERISELSGKVLNVGGGVSNTVSVLEAVKLLDAFDTATFGPGRKNEDPIFITDHSAFSQLTDWQPKVGVAEGVRRILEWAKAHRPLLERLYDGI